LELGSDVARMHSDLAQRSVECENAKAALKSCHDALSAAQAENSSMKAEIDRLSASLQNEIALNEERKKKLREYVNNLTAEKKGFEDKCTALEKAEKEAFSKSTLLEQQVSVLEIKLGTMREQGILELENKSKELMSLEAFYKSVVEEKDQEIRRLAAYYYCTIC